MTVSWSLPPGWLARGTGTGTTSSTRGEKMVLSLDGMYTAAEIGRLHGYMRDAWCVRTVETMQEPVVVGGELRVELGDVIVIVTARPLDKLTSWNTMDINEIMKNKIIKT